jgi:parallel beta-helix repeat protein
VLAGSLAGIVLVAVPAAGASTEYYVDKTVSGCSDTGTGSAANPFCTIAKGASKLAAGVTLYIGNGSYAETVVSPASGTSSQPVTVAAWPGRDPTVGVGKDNGVLISSRSYVNVSGLRVTGAVRNGISVAASAHITLSGNRVTQSGLPQSGRTASGIFLSSTTDSLVTRNTASNNTQSGLYAGSGTTGTTFSYNEAAGNAAVYTRMATGIWIVSTSNSFIGNTTHDNEDSGLNFYGGAGNNLATLNVSYNNGDHGIDNLNVNGGQIIGNTIYRNCTSGINIEGTSHDFVVKNNIAVDNAVYPAYNGISCSRRSGNIGVYDSAPPTTVADHNLVWLSKPGTLYYFGGSYTSLTALRSAKGQEGHGTQADPGFLSASGRDFRLTSSSPAIDRGDSGAPGEQPVDIVGTARVRYASADNSLAEGPRRFDDLGAYEFPALQPPPPAPVPPVAALSVSPSAGVAPLVVSASASGSSDPQGRVLSYAFDFGDGSAVVGPQSGSGAGYTFGSVGSFTVRVTVTNDAGLSSSATAQVVVSAAPPPPPPVPAAYVNQVATNYSTSSKSSGYLTVWRPTGVSSGNLAVVTLQLFGSTTSGAVAVTDSRGNSYRIGRDVSDGAGSRLVILYAPIATALAVNDRITATFPTSATGYRIAADEFAGVTQLDQTAADGGSTAQFSSGTTGTTSGGLVFAAVATQAGSGDPAWTNGWRAITPYAVGSSYLARAYQLPTSAGAYSASGTTSGTWLAAVVTFTP